MFIHFHKNFQLSSMGILLLNVQTLGKQTVRKNNSWASVVNMSVKPKTGNDPNFFCQFGSEAVILQAVKQREELNWAEWGGAGW